MIPDILPMKPYFREAIWGGRGLVERYGKPLPNGCLIGESWEVSAYKNAESVVATGPLAGQTLNALVFQYGAELMGQSVVERFGTEFPLLIKLLDARDDLSIQVHPNDAYARAEGLGIYGKMEAWYVLHSDGGQVAYGLRDGVGKADFEAAICSNRVADMVRFFKVKTGDVVFVPPGTVHALCKNVMVYEVQQSSDLTFRIWDYNRPGVDGKPRDLHIERSLDVIGFGAEMPKPQHWTDLLGSNHAVLVASDYFRLERFGVMKMQEHIYDSFAALTVLSGMARMKGEQEMFLARAGETFFVPARRGFSVVPEGGEVSYLIASVPEKQCGDNSGIDGKASGGFTKKLS